MFPVAIILVLIVAAIFMLWVIYKMCDITPYQPPLYEDSWDYVAY